ncbi:MAG: Holliday junction resolvase RuvX [Sedimentisphaeraceae bacterium JB056]
MRILAIDYGLKRTGIAICDPSETICSPLEVIEGQNGLVNRIKKIADEYQAEAILFGLPLNMDGTEGKQSQIVRSFSGEVKKATSLEVFFQDERLTSKVAERMMIDADLTRKKKKKRLDAVAAAAILQAFLENKSSGQN